MVETTIDLDELDRHNYVIKPEFDEKLQEIKDSLEGVRDSLDEEHKTVARDLDMDMDQKVLHFEQHTLYGYCFRLTRKVRASFRLVGRGERWLMRRAGGGGDQGEEVHRAYEQVERSLLYDQAPQNAQRREQGVAGELYEEAELARQGGHQHRRCVFGFVTRYRR